MVGVPFQKGYDPRRNTKGTTPSKGRRELYTKKVIEAYETDIFDVIGMVIEDAKDISKPIEKREFSISQTLKFAERFLTRPASDSPNEEMNLNDTMNEFSKLKSETINKMKELIISDIGEKTNE